MYIIGYSLAAEGFILRSGGAEGADWAFQKGCEEFCRDDKIQANKRQEIYLPWATGFNNMKPNKNMGYYYYESEEGEMLAKKFHPSFGSIRTKRGRQLMTRNTYQVLGIDVNPDDKIDMLLCWTPDGACKSTDRSTGGTGQAIRIANYLNIPVYNLYRENHRRKMENFISE